MSQTSYRIKPKEGDQEVYLKQVGKSDSPFYTFPVAEKQDDVAIGVLGMPFRPPFDHGNLWAYLELGAWIGFLLVLFGIGAVILWKIGREQINIRELLSEPDGKASLSRFQAFLFTFVFVIGVMLVLIRTGAFPTEIPLSVLAILGGSLGTYLLSKGLGRSAPATATAAAIRTASPGPLLRIKPTTASFSVQHVDIKSFRTGNALFVLPTVVGEPQDYTIVAVVVGQNDLALRPRSRSGASVMGKVQYIDTAGNAKTDVFVSETRVTTSPNKITEVGVAFTADTAGELVDLEIVPV